MKNKVLCMLLSTAMFLGCTANSVFAGTVYLAGVEAGVETDGSGTPIYKGKNAKDIALSCIQWGFMSGTYSKDPYKNDIANHINSTFVYLGAHGNESSLTFKHRPTTIDGARCDGNHSTTGVHKYAYEDYFVTLQDPNTDLSNVNVILFDGCNSSGLAKASVEIAKPAKAAVGFTQTPDSEQANKWTLHFVNAMAMYDYSVREAIKYADDADDYSENSQVDNNIGWGNLNTRLQDGTRSVAQQTLYKSERDATIQEDINPEDIKRIEAFEALTEKTKGTGYEVEEGDSYNFSTGDTSFIEEYIKQNIDSEFDVSKFTCTKLEDKENQIATIVYQYMIDGEGTNFKYKARVDDGKLSRITAFGDIVYEDKTSPVLARSIIPEDEIKAEAIANSDLPQYGFEPKKQHIILKTDPDNNEPYAVVLTDYETAGEGKRLSRDVYIYHFNNDEINDIFDAGVNEESADEKDLNNGQGENVDVINDANDHSGINGNDEANMEVAEL